MSGWIQATMQQNTIVLQIFLSESNLSKSLRHQNQAEIIYESIGSCLTIEKMQLDAPS